MEFRDSILTTTLSTTLHSQDTNLKFRDWILVEIGVLRVECC